MRILPVNDKRTQKEFINLPAKIYKDDPMWIRPWDHEIEEVFDPAKNKFFEHGECERWILQNDAGETVGRVAAFINTDEAYEQTQPTGGMGFFESIDDQKVAFALFDHCKAWLEKRGMEAMDGPVNFGEKDKWWGLLIETISEPVYGMNYHPKYYQKFFEAYGFKVYFEQYYYSRQVMGAINERLARIGDRLIKNPDYTFPKFSKKKINVFAEHFRQIYNEAWVHHEGFKEMSKEQAQILINKLKPIVDDDLVIFCCHKGRPVGFFVSIPDLNQLIKPLNGKFNLWAKLKFLYYLKTGKAKKFVGVVYGVIPEFQRKGVEAALVRINQDFNQTAQKYEEFEIGWLGDFNPTMHRIADMLYCEKSKTLYTYRKLFDETKPFVRRPIKKTDA